MTPQEAIKFFKDPVHANRLAHFVTGNYIPTAETRRAIGTLASAYLESPDCELSALPPLSKKPMERERFIIVPDLLALAVVDTSVSPAEVWCRMPTFGDSALDKAKKVCAALNAMFPVEAKEPQ